MTSIKRYIFTFMGMRRQRCQIHSQWVYMMAVICTTFFIASFKYSQVEPTTLGAANHGLELHKSIQGPSDILLQTNQPKSDIITNKDNQLHTTVINKHKDIELNKDAGNNININVKDISNVSIKEQEINTKPIDKLSFGFVNKQFRATKKTKPALESFIEDPSSMGRNFKTSDIGKNVGRVLKAGAALRNAAIVNSKDPPKQRSHHKNGDIMKKIYLQEQVTNQSKEPPNRKEQHLITNKTNNKNIVNNIHNKNSNPSLITNMLENYGPMILAGMSSGIGNQNGNDQISSIVSIVKNVGSKYLEINRESNNRKAVDHSEVDDRVSTNDHSKSSYSNSDTTNAVNIPSLLFNNIAPLIGKAFRPSEHEEGSENQNNFLTSLQSLGSKVGPVLLSAALAQATNSNSNKGGNNGLIDNLINGVLPMLTEGQNNGNSGLQSVLAAAVPSLLNHVMNTRNSPLKEKPINPYFIEERNREFGGSRKLQEKKLDYLMTLERNLTSEENVVNDHARMTNNNQNHLLGYENFNENKYVDDVNENSLAIQMWKWATDQLVNKVLPNVIELPDKSENGGYLSKALQLLVDKKKSTRNSFIWELLRGKDPKGHHSIATVHKPWMKEALLDPVRQTFVDDIKEFYSRLTTIQSVCQNIQTVGGIYYWKENVIDKDQEVCMDRDVSLSSPGCIVLSFGIRNEWSFEEKAEEFGCEVWAFDSGMTTGNHNHTDHIHFYALGLDDDTHTITHDEKILNLFTYSAILRHLNLDKSPITFLKIDIPGNELQVLTQILHDTPDFMSRIDQLGMTIHLEQGLTNNHHLHQQYNQLFTQMEQFGFQLFSSIPSEKFGDLYKDPLLGNQQVSLVYKIVFLRI